MLGHVSTSLRRLAASDRLGKLVARAPVHLVYHGVSDVPESPDMVTEAFEAQMRFVASRFEVVAPEAQPAPRTSGGRSRVVLTFDDGLGSTHEIIAPVLRRLGLPAVFFVNTRHSTPGEYLWFRHIDLIARDFRGAALRFRDRSWDMSSHAARLASIAAIGDILLDLTPHPAAMYDAIKSELPRLEDFGSDQTIRDGRGMTEQEVRNLASDPLFMIAAHTVDHPYLTRCSAEESERQLREGRAWVERVTGVPCLSVAYPSGDYNAATLRQARAAGFRRAYAVRPVVGVDPEMEVGRFGIHREALEDLAIKVYWGTAMRRAGLRVD